MFKRVNFIIKTLVISDFFLNCGWGLLAPVFAIFIVKNIATGSIAEGAKIAGFASLFYWGTKSFLQIPIGIYLDKNHGEKDDLLFMVLGTLLAGLVPFGYLFSFLPWHVYFWQVIHGIGMAMIMPSWMAVFTRHIDIGKEAFEWGVESTAIGAGAGITGALGGMMVALFGFRVVFILTGTLTVFSALLILLIKKEISPRDKTTPRFPPLVSPF